MRMIKYCLMAVFICQAGAEASWEMRAPKGFHWYTENPRKIQSETNTPKTKDSRDKETPYTEKVKQFQVEMEEKKAQAILEPTYENVSAYKKIQEKAIDDATDFSKMWMHVNLAEGGLRPEDNGDNQFRKLYDKEQGKILDQQIKTAAKTYGLFFFFKKDCPYCHQFAPLLKNFAAKYGFEVKAISQDGSGLSDYPNPSPDNGIGKVLNPEGVYPALFMANPHTNDVMPLAWGMVSEEQLRTNMKHTFDAMASAQHMKGEGR